MERAWHIDGWVSEQWETADLWPEYPFCSRQFSDSHARSASRCLALRRHGSPGTLVTMRAAGRHGLENGEAFPCTKRSRRRPPAPTIPARRSGRSDTQADSSAPSGGVGNQVGGSSTQPAPVAVTPLAEDADDDSWRPWR
eukprot:TRINITY_DN73579_c0_g1_i1.p1 TRINITY_DN73579_c0_g1~~TRINITY_DN73579_c0_g1_i1.p1  ORF type:complete len:140 (+),score=12.72 TRINITY_DN73579_c0_g1_i1:73-492(+)